MPTNFRVSSLIPTGLIVDSVTQDGDVIIVTAHARAQMAMCPLCCSPSQRVTEAWYRCQCRRQARELQHRPESNARMYGDNKRLSSVPPARS